MGIATQYEGGLKFDGDQMYITTSGGTTLLTLGNTGNATFAGTIGATNFSGSSSGTNTGDQTLPTASSLGAVTLTGNQSITGTKEFSNSSLVIKGTHASISFIDTTAGSDDWYLHANSNNFYILTDRDGGNSVDANYETPHPLELRGSDNTAFVFGNQLKSAAYTLSTAYATAAQGATADAALPKGASSIGTGVHLNLKNTTTTGYSEMSMSNDANDKLVFGSIGSAYTNTAWAGSRYIYSTAGELRIKAATNLRLYSGGMNHTGDLAVTFDSSQDATFTGTIAADNFSGSSSGTNTGDQDLSSYLTSVAFSDLTSKPSTLSGYGITDGVSLGTDNVFTGDNEFEGDLLRTNQRISNNQEYPLGHYTPGETVFELDPTWSNRELRQYFGNDSVSWDEVANAPGGYAVYINGSVSVGGVYGSGFPYIPIDQDGIYYMECWIKNAGTAQGHYMGSMDYESDFTHPSSGGGNPGSYGYFVMSNYTSASDWTKVSGYITGHHNSNTGAFETDATYWTPQALFNYSAGTGTRACWISGWKVIRVDHVGDRTFGGNLTVTGNQYFNGQFIEGDGKEIIRYSDAWLRINEDNDFSSGIYCGTGVLRTDGAFQIGSGGSKALITAAGAATFLGAVSASNFSGSSSGTNTGDQTTLPATTSDMLDFFQDNSGVSLHQFNNSLNDVGGNYNATSTGASYGTGLDTRFGTHGINTQGDGTYVDIAGLPQIQAVSIWYKAIGNDNGYIIDFRHDNPSNGRSYLYTLAGSDQYVSWDNDTTRTGNTGDIWINGVAFTSGRYDFTSGNWYHIVLSTNDTSTAQTWNQGIRIGNRSDGTTNGNAGYFDQVRTFNRRLTSSDVALLYAEVETGATADQTAEEILSLIKTVDGATSGLDADLLDGNHASAFTYSAGTLLDISSNTFNVDLTELTNNTSTFAPTQDHFVILDNGVQGKKLASSIFGSAAYEASSAFAAASHNHAGVYVPEYENMSTASGAEHDMHIWRKNHASYSNNSGNLTYLAVHTNVPQDNYSMGGFTLVYQEDYSSSGEGGEIKIYGYWNPESNNGFEGFRYECSNPYHTPTIEVARNSTSGKTSFFISGEGGSYAQLIAKDLWLGYSANSATSQWGDSWVIEELSAKDGYTNFNTLNRNDFAAITTDGSTPSLTGGVSAAQVRTLIGAQVAGSYLTAHPSITEAADVNNSGGTVIQDLTFDDNGHVTATGSVNLDNIYTSTDGTEDDYRFGLNLGNFTGTRWYKVATVNVGSGGLRIRGMMTNHVESFGSNMTDIAIQGREAGGNNDIEITGHVHVLHENAGIAIYSGEKPGSYLNWDVYVVATKYTQCQLDLTKVSGSFDTSKNYVTTEPSGTLELETYQLAEGNYVIRDSAAKRIFDQGINLAGGLSYTPSTNTLTQSDNNTEYSAATTSANGLMSSTDKTKLNGIEASADVTDSTNVAAAGALMKSGGTMTGTLAGDGTNLISGFVAPQNPEGSHIKAPWFFNDLAYARLKGATVSVTVNGGSGASNSTIDAMFDASTGYGSFSTSNVTSVVIEISNMPKNFTYGTHLGITFGNTTWRAKDVQLESYYGSQWNTILDVSNQPNEYVVKSYNSSSSSQTKLRWTLSNFNAGTMRIVSLFCYNYNATGMPSLFMPLNGGTMYGGLTMNTGNINLSGNKIYADTSSPTAHIQVGAGTTNTGSRSDVALLGAGNSGGVVHALGLVNTAAGTNSNGVALNFHNGNAWSPTGQIIVQQDSTGTATNSAMKFYTYSGGLNHRMSIKSDGVVRFNSYGTGILSTDTNGNISAISDGTSGQVLTTNGSGGFSFTTVTSGSSYTLPTATGSVLGGIKVGDNLTITAEGILSATDTDTVYTHPTSAGNKHIPTGGAAGQFLKYSASGTAVWATPSYTTNTNTTYSAGTGLDLTSTTFSVEPDLRDGITHVGKDANNYIQFDSTNGRIDFYAGGVFVARMESDGDLHIKGDVIAFSDIFG